jgi:predicted metalloprotease
MEWRGRRESTNVEDRRGMPGGRTAVGGGIGAVVLALAYWFFTGDPTPVMQTLPQVAEQAATQRASGGEYRETAADAEMKKFVATVLAETEDVWSAQFQARGGQYEVPKLVLYSGATDTACGVGESAMGPFYCPGDRRVFLDMAFFQEMGTKLGASGDFAYAYVIAHEVGHHVQNLLGISTKVHDRQQRADERQANALSVRLELQADCLAGVWANRMEARQHTLDPGDVEEALNAASAVGDDRLQKQARGYAVPDSFTHGSSEQRMRWFQAGFTSGKMESCDTFSSRQL